MNVKEHLRGEHTFWPWVKTEPPTNELLAAIAEEKKRERPRIRILRSLQTRVLNRENAELLKK